MDNARDCLNADDSLKRRLAWMLTLAVFLPFALASLFVFSQSVSIPPEDAEGMDVLLRGEHPKPKIMRRLDHQALRPLPYVRIGARVLATIGGLSIVLLAAHRVAVPWKDALARENDLMKAEARQKAIRATGQYLLEMILVAFGFFFAGMAILLVFTMTQTPRGAPSPLIDRFMYHIQGDTLYYSTFQFAEIIVFCGGAFGLAVYRASGLRGWRTLGSAAAGCAILLLFNKAAYFILPLLGYIWDTINIAKDGRMELGGKEKC